MRPEGAGYRGREDARLLLGLRLESADWERGGDIDGGGGGAIHSSSGGGLCMNWEEKEETQWGGINLSLVSRR